MSRPQFKITSELSDSPDCVDFSSPENLGEAIVYTVCTGFSTASKPLESNYLSNSAVVCRHTRNDSFGQTSPTETF